MRNINQKDMIVQKFVSGKNSKPSSEHSFQARKASGSKMITTGNKTEIRGKGTRRESDASTMSYNTTKEFLEIQKLIQEQEAEAALRKKSIKTQQMKNH